MRSLIYFELKKILLKKITWVTLIILLAIQIFLVISGNFGSAYVDGVFVETHMEGNQLDRKNGILLSGRTIDQALLEDMQNAYANIDLSDGASYLLTEEYQKNARVYADIHSKVQAWLSRYSEDDLSDVSAEQLYQLRVEKQNAAYESYGLSQNEITYWKKKEGNLPAQFKYQYAAAYEFLVSMYGGYMSLMLLTFFIAIIMGNVFMEDHTRKTQQILSCTRNGKGKLYLSKIITGSLVSFFTAFLFVIVSVLGTITCYGSEGFNARIQATNASIRPLLSFTSSYDLSIGQEFLIIAGIVLLSSVFIGILTMVLSEALQNSIGAMAFIIGGLFAARLITVPVSWRVLSKLWNIVPINLVKVDQGFFDLRLFSIGGLQLTSWQIAPIIYLLLAFIFVLLGRFFYCRNRD